MAVRSGVSSPASPSTMEAAMVAGDLSASPSSQSFVKCAVPLTVIEPTSPSSSATVVLPASPSSTTTVVVRSAPAFPSSPTSVLLGSPLVDITLDLSGPIELKDGVHFLMPDKGVLDPTLYVRKPAMVWDASLSEFVLNRMVELVKSGVRCNNSFRETYMQKIAEDVFDFTGIRVTTLQPYNHIRNRRMKWNMILKLKAKKFVRWMPDSSSFAVEEEDKMRENVLACPKLAELVNKSIVNFAQTKTIFTPRYYEERQLWDPRLLIQVIDVLIDNKEEHDAYAKMGATQRRSSLRI